MRALRDIAGLACGIALIAASIGFVGNADYADALVVEAMEKEARPQRRAQAELLCQCLKVHRGKFLRVQVTHQPDREFCRAVCYYDGGTVTRGAP